jgi:hypothetical protein
MEESAAPAASKKGSGPPSFPSKNKSGLKARINKSGLVTKATTVAALVGTVADGIEKRNTLAGATEPLNAGDTIFLKSMGLGGDEYYLTAEGFSRPSVYVAAEQPSDFRGCLFRICYPLTYDSRKSAKKLGASISTAVQKQLLAREDERNELSLRLNCGSAFPITYGQAVQLQHVQSRRFLTISGGGAPALVDRDCMRVELKDGGNDGGWFL